MRLTVFGAPGGVGRELLKRSQIVTDHLPGNNGNTRTPPRSARRRATQLRAATSP